jgi:hypothetical protein
MISSISCASDTQQQQQQQKYHKSTEVFFANLTHEDFPLWWPVVLYPDYFTLFHAEFNTLVDGSDTHTYSDRLYLEVNQLINAMSMDFTVQKLTDPELQVAFILGTRRTSYTTCDDIVSSMTMIYPGMQMIQYSNCQDAMLASELLSGKAVNVHSDAGVAIAPRLQNMFVNNAILEAMHRVRQCQYIPKKQGFQKLFYDLTGEKNVYVNAAKITSTVTDGGNVNRVSCTPASKLPFSSPVQSTGTKSRNTQNSLPSIANALVKEIATTTAEE